MTELTPSPAAPLTLLIKGKRLEAQGVYSFELVDLEGQALPPFTAGAHLEFHLSSGTIRHYSLCNSPLETHRYCVAVLKQEDGRGGSIEMSELQVGDTVTALAPRNNFELNNTAKHSVLIAGGIGITPILAMAQKLEAEQQSFEIHYLARSRSTAAYLDTLAEDRFAAHTQTYFQDEAGIADLGAVITEPKPDSHLYVCGPAGLMDGVFDTATAKGWSPDNLHKEYFQAEASDNSDAEAFEVKLKSSGETFQVPAHRTLFDVLDEAGAFIPCSCLEGVCGTCVTPVVSGEIEHRDVFLSQQEKDSNQLIAVCCSRAKGTLVLDL